MWTANDGRGVPTDSAIVAPLVVRMAAESLRSAPELLESSMKANAFCGTSPVTRNTHERMCESCP